MISGHGTVETAVEAIRLGAYDFLEKPLSIAKLLVTVDRALENSQLYTENTRLRNQLEPVSDLVGHSPAIQEIRRQIGLIGSSDSWVLVRGEPGSGKGVVARALHQVSHLRDRPFVEVNLAGIPAESIEIALFGLEMIKVYRPVGSSRPMVAHSCWTRSATWSFPFKGNCSVRWKKDGVTGSGAEPCTRSM